MPTLPHLLPLLYILILNQTCHKKSTVFQYHATVVWVCPCYSGVGVSLITYKLLKNILRIIFVVGDVKNENIPLSFNSFCVSGS